MTTRRGRPWTLALAAAAAAAVALGGIGIGILQRRGGSDDTPGPPNVDTRVWVTDSSEDGWLVRHPPGWPLAQFRIGIRQRSTRTGALITNRPASVPRTDSGELDFDGQPATLVSIEIAHDEGGPTRPTTSPDTAFPLDLHRGTTLEDREFVRFTLPLVVERDAGWSVTVRLGARATALDVEIARRIVSSFGFEGPPAEPVGGGRRPLNLEERMIAHEIAESYAGTRRALKGRTHSHPSFAEDAFGRCGEHRCAIVIFEITDGLRFQVAVDLSTKTVAP